MRSRSCWPDGALQLDYQLVRRRSKRLALPAVAAPERKPTNFGKRPVLKPSCSTSNGYCEFNFSPSESWAAYDFSGYRADMRARICRWRLTYRWMIRPLAWSRRASQLPKNLASRRLDCPRSSRTRTGRNATGHSHTAPGRPISTTRLASRATLPSSRRLI